MLESLTHSDTEIVGSLTPVFQSQPASKAKKTPGAPLIVRPGLSVKKEGTLLDDLNQALAGETLLAFRYLYLSKIATGISSLPLSKLFKEMADGEWGHASQFMERIIQLGGIPI